MFRRARKKVPVLNTTSTADISFMLLIFFLVTSSMDASKGLLTLMPPPTDEQVEQEQTVKERNVMTLVLGEDDQMRCNGDKVTPRELALRVAEFVANAHDDSAMPEKSLREVHLLGRCYVSDRHIIQIEVSRAASYDRYIQMRNAVQVGYNALRNRLARQHFGHDYGHCSAEEHDAIGMVYPQRISETVLMDEEGGRP